MAWANNITQAVMEASKAYLVSSGITGVALGSIVAGIDQDSLPGPPRIVCQCEEAATKDGQQFSGNWLADLQIRVVSNADDTTLDVHFERAGEVFSKFRTDTIAEDLSNAYPNFSVYGVVPTRQTFGLEGRSWVATHRFDIHCCGSDLTA